MLPTAWGAPDADDRSMSSMLATYWTNFARMGDPNGPDLPHWAPYDLATDSLLESGHRTTVRSVSKRQQYRLFERLLSARLTVSRRDGRATLDGSDSVGRRCVGSDECAHRCTTRDECLQNARADVPGNPYEHDWSWSSLMWFVRFDHGLRNASLEEAGQSFRWPAGGSGCRRRTRLPSAPPECRGSPSAAPGLRAGS
jgi:hypothetical protein